MQRKEFNPATFEVANRRDISGGATAEEMNRGLRTEKGKSLWRIACSTFQRSLAAAGFVFALAPMTVRAAAGGVPAEISALQTQVAELQSIVHTLQDQVSALQTSNAVLHKQLAAVQSNKALLLGPFVDVDPNPENGVIGPNIKFTGANVHILSGSNATDDNGSPTGLGNLIIGYDEDPKTFVDNSPGDDLPLSPLNPGDRGGSHNLVIGAANRFTRAAFGGVVVGTANTINGYGASVSGGAGNTAFFYGASISGGFLNTAADNCASVSGGRFNTASSPFSSVSGGQSNTAAGITGNFGFGASVSGGTGNRASGTDASICGGEGNNAIDNDSTVTGGTGNTAGSKTTFQGGLASSVVGGSGNNAGGRYTVVIGGQNVTDSKDNSIAPQPPFP
jgi:hypothetical protein